MEEVGERYFDELLSRSLFQRPRLDQPRFTMHDLINDLAKFVSGEFCFRLDLEQSHEARKRVRHFSYVRGKFDTSSKFQPLDGVKYLHTFFPVSLTPYDTRDDKVYVSNKVQDDFLPTQKYLRVISLSRYRNITHLPDSIGNHIHLRYIDLSYTTIERLPDTVCTLYNLQTLLLLGCSSLVKLPADMRKLIHLRHLDIGGTRIKKMPVHMGRLKSLRTLTAFVLGKSTGSSIAELRELSHLRGKISILNLENVVRAIDALLKDKNDLNEVKLKWVMRLSGCSNCSSLPPVGRLPALKELYVEGMKFVTSVGVEFYGGNQPFQSLEKLEFRNMPTWEEWLPSPSGGESPDFPRLKELILGTCRKLRGNMPTHLPSLEILRVRRCEVLHLPMGTLPWLQMLETNFNGGTEWLLEMVHNINRLQSLTLYDCSSRLSFPTNGLPTTLTSLRIYSCKKLEFLSREMMAKLTSLQSLDLEWSCDSLRSFPLGIFPNLSSLWIEGCQNLESLSVEGKADENLSHLNSLYIWGCPNLVSFPDGGLPTPNLTSFSVHKCENLKLLPDRMHTLTALQQLSISLLPNVVSFAQGGLPPNLQSLSISDCERLRPSVEWGLQGLVSLRQFRIEGNKDLLETLLNEQLLPTTLHTLRISSVSNLKSLDGKGLEHLTSLQHLQIEENLRSLDLVYSCDSLRSFPLGIFPNLSSLYKNHCENLESLSVEGGADENLSHLNSLSILQCPKLVSFPDGGLPTPNLTSFLLRECENLKLLPDRMHTLTALQSLEIGFFPNVVSFAQGGLPPNLQSFVIVYCDRPRPAVEWRLQGLASLREFSIGGNKDLVEEQLLPATLHTLEIYDVSNLKSLDGKGLEHLTSLQHLHIEEYESLKFLAKEGFPASLSYLSIWDCPSLKKMYLKKRYENVARIPCIEIDGEFNIL
ncbi:disease resistance RPP13-like protein 1 [Pyrus ussuriensis x Pyrus communis]|uniref:Disease resistance RPP13-like protein 1 n=1 Tax=Pyrus ussuriensis x Pyrus communis TaxID=2448454 RepID=A0A5N5GMW3_9ROSA|nr:disease resistance RPP13-like protein 1 [Pyrus ussuriensis x Pyrus communis]